MGRLEVLPRRPDGQRGASVVRRNAVMNRMEDLDAEDKKKRSIASAASGRSARPSRNSVARADADKAAPTFKTREKVESGSKQARLIAMLQSQKGGTIDAMMKATDWQQHSVRGFLAGVVRKRLSLNLVSEKLADHRVYRIPSEGSNKPGPRQSKRGPR